MKLPHFAIASFLVLPLAGCMPSDCSSLAQSVMKRSYENAVKNDEYLRRVFIAESKERLGTNSYYGNPPLYKISYYIDSEGNISKELWSGEVRNVDWSAQALGTSPFTYTKSIFKEPTGIIGLIKKWKQENTKPSDIPGAEELGFIYYQPKIKSSSGISCDVPIQRSTYTDSDFALQGTISEDNQNWSYK